ncbi:MAG: hypothetical protein IPM53_32605 [Anaerolineaceae bacterium]|nr:hypothetical protein [Anaerolineaceae bacterium]
MPFETPFPAPLYDVTISASAHEHAGAPPSTIIRTDQSWAVNVSWQTTGLTTGMIAGNWHLHCYLERIGPGADLDLVDPADHIIPLTPGTSPVNYFVHFDVPAGAVAAGLYQLVVSMTYLEPTGAPGPMAGFVEGPMLQFYTP